MEPPVTDKAWFAIKVNSRYEFRTCADLRLRDIEYFLPTRRIKRKWSDRTKTIEEPLFPGYVFGKFDVSHRNHVLRCAGVVRIVGFGRTPAPVSDDEIVAIQKLVESNVALSPYPRIPVGERVRIEQGPLAGVEGTVLRSEDGKDRLVVSVTLLQRSVAAEVDRSWVENCRQWIPPNQQSHPHDQRTREDRE
jgi:transcription antitermination factor NusG